MTLESGRPFCRLTGTRNGLEKYPGEKSIKLLNYKIRRKKNNISRSDSNFRKKKKNKIYNETFKARQSTTRDNPPGSINSRIHDFCSGGYSSRRYDMWVTPRGERERESGRPPSPILRLALDIIPGTGRFTQFRSERYPPPKTLSLSPLAITTQTGLRSSPRI